MISDLQKCWSAINCPRFNLWHRIRRNTICTQLLCAFPNRLQRARNKYKYKIQNTKYQIQNTTFALSPLNFPNWLQCARINYKIQDTTFALSPLYFPQSIARCTYQLQNTKYNICTQPPRAFPNRLQGPPCIKNWYRRWLPSKPGANCMLVFAADQVLNLKSINWEHHWHIILPLAPVES